MPVDGTCYYCNVPPPGPGDGHRQWECPKKFADEHPGRRMPGFDSAGARTPGSWNGNNTTADTKQQWTRMGRLGFFTLAPPAPRGGGAP